MKAYIALIKKLLNRVKWSPFYYRFLLEGYNKEYFRIYTELGKIERLLLYKLALSLPKRSVILEIGSYLGASSSFLALGAQKNNSKVYCCDTWKNDTMTEGPRDTFKEFLSNTKQLPKIIPLKGRSEDIGKDFTEKIDLLFIDGDHSYQGVRTDLITWLPHTKKGTILVMHDYSWAGGVIKSVDEIVKPIEIKRIKSTEDMYLGIINGRFFKCPSSL